MRMQLYVPTAKAEKYSADDKYTWRSFQNALIDAAGGITMYTAWGSWKNPAGSIVSEPVFIVEVLLVSERESEQLATEPEPFDLEHATDDTFDKVSEVFEEYALQLVRGGEEAVLFVTDNIPVFMTADDLE